MDKYIAERWATALESGEYAQTKGNLRDKKGYCCLGVLCELHRQESGGMWDKGYYFEANLALPVEVRVWARMGTSSGKYYGGGFLSSDNDCGKTFGEIARIIRERVDEL